MANIEVTRGGDTEATPEPVDPKMAALLGLTLLAQLSDEKSELSELKDTLRALATRDPIDSLLLTVLGGGLLFYHLEKGKNPRCDSVWDAVLYTATSLSVGYDDVFPKTKAGNALGALIHTFGPSLAAAAFSPPAKVDAAAAREARAREDELLATNKAILERLDVIAKALADKG